MKKKLIILGSGPAGLTAAIYAARADLNPLVIEGPAAGGQLMGTTDVDNFPGFPNGILGPELITNMRSQAEKFGTTYQSGLVKSVDFSDPGNLELKTATETFETEALIIATGANARWLDLNKGEERFWGKGYSACATCDGAFFRGKTVGVVGGGDSACEEATALTRFAEKVYLIHRRDTLRASKPMQAKVFENPKIEVLWEQNVTDLRGGKVLESVELTETNSEKNSELKLHGLFVAIGHSPATKFVGDQLEKLPNGYLKVEKHTRTRVPSVFVAGDVCDHHYRQAITASGMGCMAALDAERYLTGGISQSYH